MLQLNIYAQSRDPEGIAPKSQILPFEILPGTMGDTIEIPADPLFESSVEGHLLKSASVPVMLEEDFEYPLNGWILQGSWEVGTPGGGPSGGYKSPNCAGTILIGNYENGSDYRLISPPVQLPLLQNSRDQIELKFDEWFSMESGNDFGTVEISTNDGVSWTNIESRTGSSDWRKAMVFLTQFRGKTIRLAFHFTSDNDHVSEGWFIDNARIEIHEAGPISLELSSLSPQNFPFIYLNVEVDTNGTGMPTLDKSNFEVYENRELQTDFFEVIPPEFTSNSRLIDIVFIMDNSGSFDTYQEQVIENLFSFLGELESSGIQYALGLCRYGQNYNGGAPFLEDAGQLTPDKNYFQNEVLQRNVASGGIEPAYDAVYQSSIGFSFRPGAQRILIILSDENPYQGSIDQETAIDVCNINSIRLYALTTLNSRGLNYVATQTGGDHYDIQDNFNDILSDIGFDISNSYQVRYKSSRPYFDGVRRFVRVEVDYSGAADSDTGSYVPGALPIIIRTQETIELEQITHPAGRSLSIDVYVIDKYIPFTQTVRLFYKNTSDTEYSSTTMVNLHDSLWQAFIPDFAVLDPGMDYYLIANDGLGTSSLPRLTPTGNPFQIAVFPNEKPLLFHEPVTTFRPGDQLVFNAQISDATNFVDSVAFFHRNIGELLFNAERLTDLGNGNYEVRLVTTSVDSAGIEYYIMAWDDYGVGSSAGNADDPLLILHTTPTNGPVISNYKDELIYFVESRIRHGRNGFEAALFTPSTPAPGQPGGGAWQLDPSGAPVWNKPPNQWGDQYDFLVNFDQNTGTTVFGVDFNRDLQFDSLPSAREMTSNISDTLVGKGFEYIQVVLTGADGLSILLSELVINEVDFGTLLSDRDSAISILLEDASGSFGNISITGKVSMSGGASQERPRLQVFFGVRRSTVFPENEQVVLVERNWNLKSFYVHPDDMSPGSIFSTLKCLEQVKDMSQSYIPALPPHLNTLTQLVDGSAYYINSTCSDTLSLLGPIVDGPAITIDLDYGWNLIGYPFQTSVEPETAFASMISNNSLIQVKNMTQSYDPLLPFFLNTLTTLDPGEGYLIYLNDPKSFVYPALPPAFKKSADVPIIEMPWQTNRYPQSMVAYVRILLDGESTAGPGILGAFVDDQCRGQSIVVNQSDGSYATIVIHGTGEEIVTFRLWDKEKEFTSDDSFISLSGKIDRNIYDIHFQSGGLSEIPPPARENRVTLFPNPAKTHLQVNYEILNESWVEIEIIDLIGRSISVYRNLETAGFHTLQLNDFKESYQLDRGIYFLRFSSYGYQVTKKIIIQ